MSQTMQALKRRIHGIMFKLPGMITCDEFEGFILAYLEDDLPPAQKRVFEIHLKVCKSCRQYLAAYRRTLTAAAALGDDSEILNRSVPEDLVTAILKAREE